MRHDWTRRGGGRRRSAWKKRADERGGSGRTVGEDRGATAVARRLHLFHSGGTTAVVAAAPPMLCSYILLVQAFRSFPPRDHPHHQNGMSLRASMTTGRGSSRRCGGHWRRLPSATLRAWEGRYWVSKHAPESLRRRANPRRAWQPPHTPRRWSRRPAARRTRPGSDPPGTDQCASFPRSTSPAEPPPARRKSKAAGAEAAARGRTSTVGAPAWRSAAAKAADWLQGAEASAVPWHSSHSRGRARAAPLEAKAGERATATGEARGSASAACRPVKPASMMAHVTSRYRPLRWKCSTWGGGW